MADSQVQVLTVTTNDGHHFDATIFSPVCRQAEIRLVFLAALGTPARVYGKLARELAKHGVQSVLPDWRGIASSSVRASRRQNFSYRHLLEVDIPALLKALEQQALPTWIGGHSLGGQLALLTLATQSAQLQGAVLIASGSVHLAAYPPRLQRKIRLLLGVSLLCAGLFGYFPGHRLGFANREARGVMRDWGYVAKTGRYAPVGSVVDYEHALATLRRPVLSLNFEADDWSPASAADALLAKLIQAPKRIDLLVPTMSGGQALDHFSWTKQPDLIVPRLINFFAEPFQPTMTRNVL